MESIKQIIYSGREFINMPGTDDSGFIHAEISWRHNYGFDPENPPDKLDEDDSNGAPGEVEYILKFGDCVRSIDFSIEGDKSQDRKNSIHKVDKMIEVLQGFRKGLDEAFIAENHIKNYKLNEKLKAKKKEEEKSEDSVL
jgi:hypothetical protein